MRFSSILSLLRPLTDLFCAMELEMELDAVSFRSVYASHPRTLLRGDASRVL
jgi:hypothetical protein